MKHNLVVEKIYEDEDLSFFTRLNIAFHLLFCKRCAAEALRYESARSVMQSDFFSDAPSVADSVLETILENEAETSVETDDIRNWIFGGVVLIAALTTAFFGLDAANLFSKLGDAITIPLAIAVGTAITAYILVFAGSHLAELSKKSEFLFGADKDGRV